MIFYCQQASFKPLLAPFSRSTYLQLILMAFSAPHFSSCPSTLIILPFPLWRPSLILKISLAMLLVHSGV